MEFVDQNENQVEKTVVNEAQPETPSSVNDDGEESTENVDEEVGRYCVVIPPETDETAKDKAPVDRIVIPADVTEIHEDDEQVYIIGTRDGKVTQIVGLEKVKQLKSLILRSCLIGHMGGVQDLIHLEKLELYDNHIEDLTHIDRLSKLRILDLSFNSIRAMIPLVQHVPLLEELYMAQNKLRKIEGLEGLVHLRTLDLGANRIRLIEGLETNTALESLWLGKNKIEEIRGLDTLTQLRQLDIQNNRLTSLIGGTAATDATVVVEGEQEDNGEKLEAVSSSSSVVPGIGLRHLHKLEELYLACNKIEVIPQDALPSPSVLSTVDLSNNGVCDVSGLEFIPTLEEVWLSSSKLPSFESLKPLMKLPALTCLYLEHSPIAKDYEYRKTLTRSIPTLTQLDATLVNRLVK